MSQTWPAWEAILLEELQDRDVAAKLSFGDPRIRRFPTAPGGNPREAYNRALETCRGTYVGSLAAGDRLDGSRLELQVSALESSPELDLVGTRVTTLADVGTAGLDGEPRAQPSRTTRLAGWFEEPLHLSSVILRRDAHVRVGGLDPELSCMAPTELLARCLARGLRTEILPAVLTQGEAPGVDEIREHGDLRPLLESAFIFSAHLAPLFLRAGRSDLFARGLHAVADQAGEAAGDAWTEVVSALRLLIGWRDGFSGFSAAFIGGCERWQVIEASARQSPSRATAAAARPPSVRGRALPPLVILDDYFPDLNTAFRVAEFNDYLERFDCEVLSTHAGFAAAHQRYAERYPHLAGRVKRFSQEELEGRSAAYMVFIHNAWRHLPDLETARLPFAFTLYPGMEMYDPTADLMLQTVARSPLFHRLLATQHVTLDYFVEGQFGDPARAELVWGIPVPTRLLELPDAPRRRYGRDKDTVDLCFTAHRYMPGGSDKGYDAFVRVARILARESPVFRFHVVGGMAPDDVALGDLASRFTFYTPQLTEFFPEFYRQIDVIVSPNRPFTRRAGGFDGFPTGCCIDAALCGVPICCTDAFGENRYFVPGQEILVTTQDAEAIAGTLRRLPQQPEKFEAMGAAGRTRCRELYSVGAQLEPRRALLEGLLREAGRPV